MSALDEQLFEAIEALSVDGMEAALAVGADPYARRGDTLAYDLVEYSPLPEMRCALIEAGFWDERLADGLVWAAGTKRPATVKALIDRGADVNSMTNSGTTPLLVATAHEQVEMVRMLLAAGADPTVRPYEAPLAAAARKKRSDLVGMLLDAGASPDARGTYLKTPAIAVAAALGDLDTLDRLIAAGAEVDARCPELVVETTHLASPDSTPLILAARHGHAQVLTRLLVAGADPHLEDAEGRSAAEWAREAGQKAILATLAEVGVHPPGRAPAVRLMEAAERGDVAGVRSALSDAAPVDVRDERKTTAGLTPLQLAAWGGHLEVVTTLLQAGAAVDAVETGHPGAVRRISHFTDEDGIRASGFTLGRTALMLAAERGHAEIVRVLLDAKAVLDLKDFLGTSALQIAETEGRDDIVAALVASGAVGKREGAKSPSAGKRSGKKPSPSTEPRAKKAAGRSAEAVARPAPGASTKKPRRRKKVPRSVPVPSFTVDEGFHAAVTDLAERCGSAPAALGEGAFEVAVAASRRAQTDTEAIQREFLSRGCFVFEPTLARGGPEALDVISSTDRYEAIAFRQTRAPNFDLDTGDIIEWMRALEAQHAYVLTLIDEDALGGRFLQPVADPDELAERMYAFCPDIVDQGCGSVEELARTMRESQDLFFWWD